MLPIFFLLALTNGETDLTVLMNRALLALIAVLVAIVAYFLRQTADDIRTTRATVASHSKLLARHGVMYELWLDDFTERYSEESAAHEPIPRRRKTDILREVLAGIVKEENADS